LRRLQKEATILCILVTEGIVEEVHRFVRVPHEYTEVSEAKDRVILVLQQADTLLQEHDRREAAKNEPPKESDLAVAMRRFREKQQLELEAERVASVSNSRSEDL